MRDEESKIQTQRLNFIKKRISHSYDILSYKNFERKSIRVNKVETENTSKKIILLDSLKNSMRT
jgi:hypothetical protein